jgi:hypothetical protein
MKGKYPQHTCADLLISIEDDAGWAAAMETRKTCPACQFNIAENLRIEDLAKALKSTGKPRVTIIRGKAKAPKGVQY